ncbi:MAG: tRNA pseudouridine(38-40) synthase TruA [bacterium]
MNRTFRLTIKYDGTRYAGWQVQPGQKTIQGELEEALRVVLNTPCRVTAAGRTDAGVHALGQVAHCRTDSGIPAYNLRMALNSILPKDISIEEVFDVHPDFHARKQALAKRYIYKIFRGLTRDPFQWPYTWFLPDKLDIKMIKVCLPMLQGEHDFSAFSVAKNDHMSSTRKLMKVELVENDNQMQFEFLGNSFLRKQIRRMVGTLIEVGRGRFTPDEFNRILLSGDPTQAGPTAPPQGLFLVRVYYSMPFSL